MRESQEGLIQPDLIFILDITVAESWRRRPKRSEVYEADHTRLKTAARYYQSLALTENNVVLMEGVADPQEIAHRIYQKVIAHALST
jgi:thymidylate kinase